MKLIVGLGNPGIFYAGSRHNVGFMVVKALCRQASRARLKSDKATLSLSAKTRIDGNEVILAQPMTYMNLSGAAVKALCEKYKVGLTELLVVCDDLDLAFGALRARPSGSSGGHRGLESIIDSVGSSQFCRIRVGIGRPGEGGEAAQHVLSAFTGREKKKLPEVIETAAACCRTWLSYGMTQSMNAFNRRSTAA